MPNVMDLFKGFAPWAPAAGRLIWASIAMAIMLGATMAVLRRPKPARDATWAEAMAGATWVFAMFFLAYAVIPHEWITFSDQYLKWSADKFVWKQTQSMLGLPWDWPFAFTYQALRDIIVVVVYLVFFGANLALWSLWQKRTVAADSDGAAPAAPEKKRTSRFGRPLRRSGGAPVAEA